MSVVFLYVWEVPIKLPLGKIYRKTTPAELQPSSKCSVEAYWEFTGKKGWLHLKRVWTFQALRVCASLYLDNPTVMHINCQGKLMNGACAVYQTSWCLNQYFHMQQSAHSLLMVIYNEICLKFKNHIIWMYLNAATSDPLPLISRKNFLCSVVDF